MNKIKFIENHHLYVYEVKNNTINYIYSSWVDATGLGIKEPFIRGIFIPFLYDFYLHASLACDVQASDFN